MYSAALPAANAGQYATSICKPLSYRCCFWFPCKRRYVNVRTPDIQSAGWPAPLTASALTKVSMPAVLYTVMAYYCAELAFFFPSGSCNHR